MAQNLTTLNTTITTFQGTKNAGTAAANSLLAGGVYNSSPLTLTTGQQASFQFDANGYVKMNVAAGGAGGGAVYGPTANGSAAANPPVLMGGTATGGATGNVANATIKAGNTAATTDPAIVVADPNLLAAAIAPIPTQAPTVSIGGVGIVDSAGTNVATVKAASTLPVATDKTLVVGLNPGTATAGTPTGAIVTVQGVSGGTAQPVTNAGTFAVQAGPGAAATGGWTPKHIIAANSDNATNLKASAGTVHAIQVFGIGSAPAYLKFYNKASSPTCGSDAVIKSIMIPAAPTAANGNGAVVILDTAFSTGISYCVVLNIADTDDTSVAAATYSVNIDWN
jgi:hypothetical protein